MTPNGWWALSVDLTGSRMGHAFKRVDLVLDPVDWSKERIRDEAARFYRVPVRQVGEPRFCLEPVIPDPPDASEVGWQVDDDGWFSRSVSEGSG